MMQDDIRFVIFVASMLVGVSLAYGVDILFLRSATGSNLNALGALPPFWVPGRAQANP
jgi:hypothetical protein